MWLLKEDQTSLLCILCFDDLLYDEIEVHAWMTRQVRGRVVEKPTKFWIWWRMTFSIRNLSSEFLIHFFSNSKLSWEPHYNPTFSSGEGLNLAPSIQIKTNQLCPFLTFGNCSVRCNAFLFQLVKLLQLWRLQSLGVDFDNALGQRHIVLVFFFAVSSFFDSVAQLEAVWHQGVGVVGVVALLPANAAHPTTQHTGAGPALAAATEGNDRRYEYDDGKVEWRTWGINNKNALFSVCCSPLPCFRND